jgi:glyoxylate reductase
VPKVYVTRPIAEEALAMLRREAEVILWPEPEVPPSHDEIVRGVAEAEGLLCLLTDPIDREVIEAGRRLRVISTYAVGFDNIDLAAASARGILVCNTPGVLTETTADLAWALMMAAARRIPESDRYVRAGRWRSWSPQILLGHDLHGATLGIVGFGRIGQAMARRAVGFGMKVIYYNPTPKPEAAEPLGAEYRELSDLMRESDFVSLHTPLTGETRNLIGAAELALMKPTAVLVNTARGGVVEAKALTTALEEGRIFAAGLDVFESEPVAADDPLLQLENVVVLPHIGSASVATRALMARMAVENLIAGMKGERPRHLLNPEVLAT